MQIYAKNERIMLFILIFSKKVYALIFYSSTNLTSQRLLYTNEKDLLGSKLLKRNT